MVPIKPETVAIAESETFVKGSRRPLTTSTTANAISSPNTNENLAGLTSCRRTRAARIDPQARANAAIRTSAQFIELRSANAPHTAVTKPRRSVGAGTRPGSITASNGALVKPKPIPGPT